ncbi:hypothetical protein BH20ACI1_BH20ACI1_24520 [soil metagenome]
MDKRQKQSDDILQAIKANFEEIQTLHELFAGLEEDYVYRFYHQSFKVFGMNDVVKQAITLFEKIAPDEVKINDWFKKIANEAIEKEFDWQKTNPIWLKETRPILEAFWHSKYFLEQMLKYGNELDKSPQMLPSGWAAVLYLYNLR